MKPGRSPFRPRIYLPFMVVLCLMTMGLRVGQVFDDVQSGKAFHVSSVPSAVAASDTSPAAPAPAAADEKKAASPSAAVPEAGPDQSAPPEDDLAALDKSGTEIALMRELSKRRADLAARGKELDAREALVSVAEKRVEEKIKEMETLRAQVQALLGQANAAQQAQLDNLVKIYETMKPKEAARIFETMDLPILLGVVQKMKPARTAAVLSEMNPQKAKDITVALTKQDQLPQLK